MLTQRNQLVKREFSQRQLRAARQLAPQGWPKAYRRYCQDPASIDRISYDYWRWAVDDFWQDVTDRLERGGEIGHSWNIKTLGGLILEDRKGVAWLQQGNRFCRGTRCQIAVYNSRVAAWHIKIDSDEFRMFLEQLLITDSDRKRALNVVLSHGGGTGQIHAPFRYNPQRIYVPGR